MGSNFCAQVVIHRWNTFRVLQSFLTLTDRQPVHNTMNEKVLQKVYENFETAALLEAVNRVDILRQQLSDDRIRPPKIRDNLLRLHGLVMDFVHNSEFSKGEALFDLAFELEDQVFELLEHLEIIQGTLGALTRLAPDENGDYPDDTDDEY